MHWWPCCQMKVVAGIRLGQQDQGPPLWTKVTEEAQTSPLPAPASPPLPRFPVGRASQEASGQGDVLGVGVLNHSPACVEGWAGSPETTAQTTSTVPFQPRHLYTSLLHVCMLSPCLTMVAK